MRNPLRPTSPCPFVYPRNRNVQRTCNLRNCHQLAIPFIRRHASPHSALNLKCAALSTPSHSCPRHAFRNRTRAQCRISMCAPQSTLTSCYKEYSRHVSYPSYSVTSGFITKVLRVCEELVDVWGLSLRALTEASSTGPLNFAMYPERTVGLIFIPFSASR